MPLNNFILYRRLITERFSSKTLAFSLRISFSALMLASASHVSLGQASLFGSLDDPSEQLSISRWRPLTTFEGGAGFSLVGPQWYSAATLDFSRRATPTYLHLAGMVRTGVYGAYAPDIDEFYDVIRLVRAARYLSPTGGRYVRIGPLSRTRLGSGHLVNFLNTDAAEDARTVGVEARLSSSVLAFEGFSENVTTLGLVGARLSFQPFSSMDSPLSTLSVSASVVSDQKVRLTKKSPVDGQEVGIRMQAYTTGGFSFNPFVNLARIPDYGQGMVIGADIDNDNFIDLARLHFRLALHYNSSDFRSGYFGSFYTVNSQRARVVSEDESQRAGYDLRAIERGNSVETELRMYIFNRFEFWYAFLRYHGVQPLSEYHLRLRFASNRFNVSIGQDRAGLVGFISLFESLGDENRLRFEFEYRIYGPLWTRFIADYTYVGIGDPNAAIPQYIVQRRFSPILSLRYPSSQPK